MTVPAAFASSSAMPIPDLDSLMVLEAPFARSPYEDLRRRLRTHQRITDRDFASINTLVSDLAIKGGQDGRQEMLEKVELIIERVRGMKEKLVPLVGDLDASLTSVQRRTSHLTQVQSLRDRTNAMDTDVKEGGEEHDQGKMAAMDAYQQFTDTRLQRMIVDWLCRMGFISSAERLANSKRLEHFTDIALFKELYAIRDSMTPSPSSGQKASCSSALAWCVDNKVALRRIKSTLEFDLRLQEFIDLCRQRSPESLFAARTYLRRHLLPMFKTATAAVKNFEGAPEQSATLKSITQPSGPTRDEDSEQDYRNNVKIVAEVTRAFGLLATPPGGWVYQDLYNAARLPKLFGQLFTAAMSIYSLSPQPVLSIALSAGLSSLKVPACYGGERKDAHGAKSTAALSAGLAVLADINGEAPPNTTPSIPGVGEVDEDLMRDVRREVRAENDKHRQQVHSTVSSEEADDGVLSTTDETRNLNCPVCATIKLTKPPHTHGSSSLVDGLGLGTLAKEIPWSHHSNSTIVCRISGRVIDEGSEEGEGGQAVALPNGRVYSKRALETYSASLDDGAAAARKRRNEGKSASQAFVTCPRTRDRFFTGQMRRVYIS